MSELLTDERLNEIQVRCDAATPGPMKLWQRGTPHDWDFGPKDEINAGNFEGYSKGMFWYRRDAEFYAHAREDVPDLLKEVRRLRLIEQQALAQSAEVAGMRAEIERLQAENATLIAARDGVHEKEPWETA